MFTDNFFIVGPSDYDLNGGLTLVAYVLKYFIDAKYFGNY